MAVQKIIDTILKDAREEAKNIEAAARERVAEIEKRHQEEHLKKEETTQKRGESQAREAKRRVLSAADLEQRKGLLEEKQRLIGEAFQGALKKLVELDREEYAAVMEKLLMDAVEEGNEEVLISPSDADRITEQFLTQVNEKRKKAGKRGELTLSTERREIVGGFVLRRGKKEINCSLESLFEANREALEPLVAEVLFSKEG